MSKEIRAAYSSSATLYAVIQDGSGQYWNTNGTPAFENANSSHWTGYALAMTELLAGLYAADWPTMAAGSYTFTVYARAGGSPATTDGPPIAVGELAWDGAAEVTLGSVQFTADSLDQIIVEDGIVPSPALVDDLGNQLTRINARQALALSTSALAATLSGADGTTVMIKSAGGAAAGRIVATVDANGNRSAITLKVPT